MFYKKVLIAKLKIKVFYKDIFKQKWSHKLKNKKL